MLNQIFNQEKLKEGLSRVTSQASSFLERAASFALHCKKKITKAFSNKEELLSGAKELAAPPVTYVAKTLQTRYQQLQITANSPRILGYRKKADMIFSDIYHRLNPIARKQMAEVKYVLANEARILMKNNSPRMQKLFEDLNEMQEFAYGPQQYEKYESILDSISYNIIIKAMDKNGLSSERLDLKHCHLSRIPGFLFKMSDYQAFWASLKSLNLEWNNLQSLPEEFSQLSALEELWMSNNNFQTLPSVIGKLSELKILAIPHNPVESFPPEIEALKKLTTFDIDKSSLSLPANLEEANWRNPKNKGLSPFPF
jgi:hypothetical protein